MTLTASSVPHPERRKALLALAAASLLLAGCVVAPKKSAGQLPGDFKLEPLLVQTNFTPAKVSVEVVGRVGTSPRVEPWHTAEAQRVLIQFADSLRADFKARFTDDARAAALPQRSASEPGMTLSLRATHATVSYNLPGAPNYRDDRPFTTVIITGTLTNASGKELWWFKTFLFQPSNVAAADPGWQLTLGYQRVMKEMLAAMKADGVLRQ